MTPGKIADSNGLPSVSYLLSFGYLHWGTAAAVYVQQRSALILVAAEAIFQKHPKKNEQIKDESKGKADGVCCLFAFSTCHK